MFGNVDFERRALEMTYEGMATVTEYEEYTTDSGAERHREIQCGSFSCALSQKSGSAVSQGEDRAVIEYDAKLFAAPEHNIKAGSKITVSQNNMTYTFISVGEPFIYPTHQEVILKREENA